MLVMLERSFEKESHLRRREDVSFKETLLVLR